MRKLCRLSIVLLLLLNLAELKGQQAVTSAGGYTTQSKGTISYSIGQLLTESYSTNSGSASFGVQQAYQVTTITGLEANDIKLDLEVNAYPNPTIDYLMFEIVNQSEPLQAEVFDINGSLLRSATIRSGNEKIQMSGLVEAIYIVQIKSRKRIHKTFRIIKK
ncbi:MAG: T9SS type A sorting domain-containing protein [Reichenbachiella sp.]|uniref:T9SS type A sorting domain-containing protein n=1 Tax=Reichenbachiella sp. TaxID=2184521 RepID=UPI0032650FE0